MRLRGWSSCLCRLAAPRHVSVPRLGGSLDRCRVPQWGFAPIVDFLDDPGHAFLETHLDRPVEVAADQGDIGPRAVRFARPLRDMDGLAAQELDQAIDRLRLAGAQVPVPAGDAGLGCSEE